MKVLLDTNFIISCIINKIDFIDEIESLGLEILVPKQVVDELERISHSKKKKYFKDAASFSLELLKKKIFKSVNLINNYVDKEIGRAHV